MIIIDAILILNSYRCICWQNLSLLSPNKSVKADYTLNTQHAQSPCKTLKLKRKRKLTYR